MTITGTFTYTPEKAYSEPNIKRAKPCESSVLEKLGAIHTRQKVVVEAG